MNEDLHRARQLLEDGGYTCVLCRGQEVRTCTTRGIRPLLELLEQGSWSKFSAADKVVGKATAFLYILLGVHSVYAPVMSEAALGVLSSCGIEVYYEILVPAIFNRTRTGFCPMETAVKDINDATEAMQVIRVAFNKLHT